MQYHRKQKGNMGVVLMVLIIISFLAYKIISIEDISKTRTHLGIDGKIQIDKFKNLPKPNVFPIGKYIFEEDGVDYTTTYYFRNNNSIVKETIFFESIHLQGEAKYHFEGSVMIFKDPIGDVGLFSLDGEAITVIDKHTIISHSEKDTFELKQNIDIMKAKQKEVVKESLFALDWSELKSLDQLISKVIDLHLYLLLLTPMFLIALNSFIRRMMNPT
jgi:hypothetical protein